MEVFTLINVFTVEPDKQQKLVDTLAETTSTIARHIPGFISASIHQSGDGTRVVNYGQWEHKADFDMLMHHPEMQARMALAKDLGQSDGHFYTIAATITRPDEPETRTASPLAVYRTFQRFLFTGQLERIDEVVDLESYTENCVGFTPGWITGFHTALNQYQSHVASAMADIDTTEETVIEGQDSVVIRSRIEATHVGSLLSIPATGKRFSYEATDMVRIQDGRIVWRWLLSDLYAIEQQLKSSIVE